jgi:hypothetical protein
MWEIEIHRALALQDSTGLYRRAKIEKVFSAFGKRKWNSLGKSTDFYILNLKRLLLWLFTANNGKA